MLGFCKPSLKSYNIVPTNTMQFFIKRHISFALLPQAMGLNKVICQNLYTLIHSLFHNILLLLDKFVVSPGD